MTIVGESFILFGGMLGWAVLLNRNLKNSKDNPQTKKAIDRAIFLFTASTLVLTSFMTYNHIIKILYVKWLH